MAVVKSEYLRSPRLTCTRCSTALTWTGDQLHVRVDGEPLIAKWAAGGWVHPETGRTLTGLKEPEGWEARFGVPLWLQTTCCGGRLLWANNAAHLDYLEAYISARLRERPPPPSNLAWRLPSWMKEARNRDEILRHIGRLRERL